LPGPAVPAYSTGEMLDWQAERGIDPHIPVWVSGLGYEATFNCALKESALQQ